MTNIGLFGFIFTALMTILLLYLPRQLAVIPVIATVCFMTYGQRINIVGLNIYVLRIIIFFGWIRLICRRELGPISLNSIDKILIIWIISNMVVYTLLRGNLAALINRLGLGFNFFGLYFLFRFLVCDLDDIQRVFKIIAILSIPVGFLFLFEYMTGRNPFAVLGGVHEITVIRNERLRCMGAFRHPILAGTFGAMLIPLCAPLWFKGNSLKLLAIAVFIAGTFITIASGSSGPLATYVTAFAGLFMWHFRENMKTIRWGAFSGLIALNLYMKAPIWYLIDRVGGLIGGGTGYHRSRIIDQAIRNFSEWWLLGTDYTVHWTGRAIRANPRMADITNFYIRQAVDGGLLTMVLFVILIVVCFKNIGKILRIMGNQPLYGLTLWSMGVMLFAHVVTLMSVTYFGQNIVLFFLLLAMISSASSLSCSIERRSESW